MYRPAKPARFGDLTSLHLPGRLPPPNTGRGFYVSAKTQSPKMTSRDMETFYPLADLAAAVKLQRKLAA